MSTCPALPSTWAVCQLGDVVAYGATEKVEPAAIPSDAWILELEDIEKDTSRVLHRLTFSARQSKSLKHRFAVGDVLYGKLRPYLNKVVRADQPGFCTTEIIPLKPPLGISGGYLFYWLKHPQFVEYVTAVSHGLSMPRLGTAAAVVAPLILAPQCEQRRIVAKLDAMFARVDSCRQQLERVAAILKRLRLSVLGAAISGELTQSWRRTHGVTDTWEHTTLGQLIMQGPQNGLYKPTSSYGQGTRILRIDNFYDGVTRPWTEFKRLQLTSDELSDYALAADDIVINRVNSLPLLGKVTLIRDLPEPCVFESNMMRIRLNREKIHPEYALLVLMSPLGVAQLQRNAKHAVNQASINQHDVRRVEVPLPSLCEQQEIIVKAHKLLAAAQRLVARREQALHVITQLSSSLLTTAFRGELVPQDPTEEPASLLLKRIQSAHSFRTLHPLTDDEKSPANGMT